MGEKVTVLDCDGHIIESIPEMVEYMDPRIRHITLTTSRKVTPQGKATARP